MSAFFCWARAVLRAEPHSITPRMATSVPRLILAATCFKPECTSFSFQAPGSEDLGCNRHGHELRRPGEPIVCKTAQHVCPGVTECDLCDPTVVGRDRRRDPARSPWRVEPGAKVLPWLELRRIE